MYEDDLARALSGNSPAVLLHEMTGAARARVVEALAAAVARSAALQLARYLAAEPLAKAKAAAVEPVKAHESAKAALAKEQGSVAGRLAAFWASKRRAAPDDREHEPSRDTPEVQKLQADVAAAAALAFPLTQAVATIEQQISGLRNAPAPDPEILTILAESLCGCHVDAPKVNSATVNSVQARPAGAAVGGSPDAH